MEEDLEKFILEIFKEYRYLNLDKKEFLKMTKIFLENINYDDLETCKKKIVKYWDSYVMDQLKEDEYQLINNCINFTYNENMNDLAAIVLRKIGNIFKRYELHLSINFLSELLSNNSNLYSLVKQYVNSNLDNLEIKIKSLNENLRYIVEIYCDENNIELKDSETQSTFSMENSISSYYQEIRKYPLLSFQEEQEIFKKIKAGDKESYDYFVKCNLRLVLKYANKYYISDVDHWDLVQEGNMGLMKAIDMFNPSRGYKFSTYAKWWIEQSIRRFVNRNRRSLRLPEHVMKKISNYKKVKEQLEKKLNREITTYDIAKVLEISETEVLQLEVLMRDSLRLNDYINDLEEDTELVSFIPSQDELVEDIVINKLEIDEMKDIINELNISDRDRRLIYVRYGLSDGVYRTLEETGKIFNLTRERVRQIELRNLRKIKKHQSLRRVTPKPNVFVKLSQEENVFKNLNKIGSREYMEEVIKYLEPIEIKTLNSVFGRVNLNDGSISVESETYFYNVVLPKIKKIYNSLKKTNKFKPKKITNNSIEKNQDDVSYYDSIDIEDVKQVISILRDEISIDLYNSISLEERIILGFKINNIGKKVTTESISEFLGMPCEDIIKISSKIMNYYQEYSNKLNSKTKRK